MTISADKCHQAFLIIYTLCYFNFFGLYMDCVSIPTPGCLTCEALQMFHLDFYPCYTTIIEHVCMALLGIFPLMDQLHILHNHRPMVACNKMK